MEDGEIDRRRSNIGYVGKGYKYTKEEDDRVKQERKDMAKSFGFTVDEEAAEENDDDMQSRMLKKEEEQLKQE